MMYVTKIPTFVGYTWPHNACHHGQTKQFLKKICRLAGMGSDKEGYFTILFAILL